MAITWEKDHGMVYYRAQEDLLKGAQQPRQRVFREAPKRMRAL